MKRTDFFEDRIVRVTYPDGFGNHTTTIPELRKKWAERGETEEWQKWFFTELERYGKAHSNFAEYELI